ncbi:myelin-oligodendrocyte glycoprotein-like [Alligator mississippiensis]|uniref:myelin-oligodendrocyte glycoprotein-like n=1 Tax=Alligator mississippiensis TaxID=8496 RepID=UPI0028775053|nr:myelin-oligodendrocyte glycoprotein-like [Alligator mississippiensis]
MRPAGRRNEQGSGERGSRLRLLELPPLPARPGSARGQPRMETWGMCTATLVLCLLLGTAAGSAPIPSTGPGCRREFISITAPAHHGVLLPLVVPDAAVDPLGATLNWQTEAVHLQSPEVMHAYTDGKDDLESQAKRFRGRTEVFPEEIDNGNASLLLKNITQNDTGTYHGYFFPNYNSPCVAVIVHLNVSDAAVEKTTKTEGGWKDYLGLVLCRVLDFLLVLAFILVSGLLLINKICPTRKDGRNKIAKICGRCREGIWRLPKSANCIQKLFFGKRNSGHISGFVEREGGAHTWRDI